MPVYLAFVPYQIRAPGLGQFPYTWPACLVQVGFQGWAKPVYLAFVPYQTWVPGLGQLGLGSI